MPSSPDSRSRDRSRSRPPASIPEGSGRLASSKDSTSVSDEVASAIDAVLKGETQSLTNFIALLSKFPLGTHVAWQAGLHGGVILDKVLPCLLDRAFKKPFCATNDAEVITLVEYIYLDQESYVDWHEFGKRFGGRVVGVLRRSVKRMDVSVQPHKLACNGHDERCLRLLSSIISHGYSSCVSLSVDVDLWPWCLWWLRVLLAAPGRAALSTKHHHASILEELCGLFSIDCVLDKGIVGILLEHLPICEPYQKLVFDLVHASSWCETAAEKILAVRVGIPQLAWSCNWWPHDAIGPGMIMALIYPVGFWRVRPSEQNDCLLLRRALNADNGMVSWCKSLKRFVHPYRILNGMLHASDEECLSKMLTCHESFFEWDIREFLADVCHRAVDDGDVSRSTSVFSEFAHALNNVFKALFKRFQIAPFIFSRYEFMYEQIYKHYTEEQEIAPSYQEELVNGHCLWEDLLPCAPLRILLNSKARILDFGVRCSYLQKHIDYVQDGMNERNRTVLVVPRTNVTDGVCHSLALDSAGIGKEAPDGNIEIHFSGEMGVDQGGVRRAWFTAVSSHFIRSDFFHELDENASHLSEPSLLANQRRPGGRRWTPAAEPVCKALQADWEEHFRLLGAILGYALLNGETVSLRFAPHVWEAMLSTQTPSHLKLDELLEKLVLIDATLVAKIKCIRDSTYKGTWGVDTLAAALEAAGLRQTFCVATSRNADLVSDHELKIGGNSLIVTEENKEEYLSLLSAYHLHDSIHKQAGLMRTGLLRVLCPNASELGLLQQNGKVLNRIALDSKLAKLSHGNWRQGEILYLLCYSFSPDELDKVFSGSDLTHEDIEHWRANTQYEGFHADSNVVKWFWSVVSKMDEEQLTQLLKFVWGSSTLPHGGFTREFTLRRMAQSSIFLPVAHTCEFSLDLPDFTSETELRDKLHRAMQEETFQIQ